MDKVFELAQAIKEDSEGVIQDYHNNNVDHEFASGVVIGNDCILNSMEEIWDINLDTYRINQNF